MNQLQKIDSAIKKRRLEFALKIDIWVPGSNRITESSNIDQCDDMNSKLTKNRADDVEVEDVGLWAFFGETFDGLDVVSYISEICIMHIDLPLPVISTRNKHSSTCH